MTPHRLLAAAAVAIAVAAACACSTQPGPVAGSTVTVAPTPTATASSPTPARTPQGGLPDPRRVDHTDATAVARAALITAWGVDSAIDQGQRDAYLRAAPYLADSYLATIRADPATPPLPAEWRRHQAYARVSAELLPPEQGAPRDTATTAYRQWRITVQPTGRDGWRADPVTTIAYTVLQRPAADRPWRITQITTA